MEPSAAVEIDTTTRVPPALIRVIEPARSVVADASPSYRDRFERAVSRKNIMAVWRRVDWPSGFTQLEVGMWQADGAPMRRVALTRRSEGLDEAVLCEQVCELVLEPLL